MLTKSYPLVPPNPAHEAAKEAVADVLGKLEAFGSPEALALFFAEQGIKGVMGCARTCAVAQYLQRELDNPDVHVSSAQVSVARGCEPDANVGVGPVVAQFVMAFDDWRYPELTTGQIAPQNLVVLG